MWSDECRHLLRTFIEGFSLRLCEKRVQVFFKSFDSSWISLTSKHSRPNWLLIVVSKNLVLFIPVVITIQKKQRIQFGEKRLDIFNSHKNTILLTDELQLNVSGSTLPINKADKIQDLSLEHNWICYQT